ncbi:MAG: hypothetical protein Q7S14_01440 [bacterium]|nr:hypothetical protein [bacterium]
MKIRYKLKNKKELRKKHKTIELWIDGEVKITIVIAPINDIRVKINLIGLRYFINRRKNGCCMV